MKQVILIRKDLKMRRGKEIAQGAHASSKFLVDVCASGKQLSDSQKAWISSGMKKVCLQVNSEEELLTLWKKAKDNKLTSSLIRDSGLTEFNGIPTLTSCAIGPDEERLIDAITGHLSLY